MKRRQCKVVVRVARSRWGRQERHELSGDGINQSRRNHVRATSRIGAGSIECIHRPIRTWNRSLSGSRRSDELLPTRAVCTPTKGIVDVAVGRILLTGWQGFYRAQIPRTEGHGGDGNLVCVRFVVVDFQIVGKEKELILLDRTANIAPKIVVCEMPHRWIEKVPGIEIAIPDEFVGSAVEIVSARL